MPDRKDEVTKYISMDMFGIEVAPWIKPLVPKRTGYNSIVLDVFDTEKLIENAHAANLSDYIGAIESVDIVGDACSIAEAVAQRYELGTFDYIVSSHNLEHLPDPIRFLQGCEKVLKPGGMLSLALPDRRISFDYFRPHSTLADWLEANFEQRVRPTQTQIFAQTSLHSMYYRNGDPQYGFSLTDDPAQVLPLETLKEAYDQWKLYNEQADEVYHDVHCWTFTPSSFELIIRDLGFLELSKLQVLELAQADAIEFFVHLRNMRDLPYPNIKDREYYDLRRQLLHRINNEGYANCIKAYADSSSSGSIGP